MADKTQIIITLRKEVADEAGARAVYQTVKQKMADNPDITITGHISNHLDVK